MENTTLCYTRIKVYNINKKTCIQHANFNYDNDHIEIFLKNNYETYTTRGNSLKVLGSSAFEIKDIENDYGVNFLQEDFWNQKVLLGLCLDRF